jgi:hypothetical protein
MRCFYLISGLKTNIGKCNLYGVGIDSQDLNALVAILKCRSGNFPFNYLGLKVGANMNRVNNWNSVIEVFKSCLSVWKAQTLSIGGRTTLIKSEIDSLPNYFFSLYKAPAQVLETLEAICRKFFWAERKIKPNLIGLLGTGLGHLKRSGVLALAI